MVLEGQNFAHLHEKRMIFFVSSALFSPTQKTPMTPPMLMILCLRKKKIFSQFLKRKIVQIFLYELISRL
jgi:hypothetical protein